MPFGKKILKYTAFAAANFVGAFIVATVAGVHYSTLRGSNQPVDLKELDGYPIKNLEVETSDGIPISAWHIKNSREKVVVLLSGRHSNRDKNIEKAKTYLRRGFSVVMPDLRATGKSGGERVSFGWNERKDLLALYEYLRKAGYRSIGAHGFSMGGATICYSHLHMVNFSFVVLESCYAVLSDAYKGAFRKYKIPRTMLRGMRPLTEYMSGFKEENMQPIHLIHLIKCPLLVMAGEDEMIVSKKSTISLFRNNQSNTSKLHFFKNGEHENFSEKYKDEYVEVLEEFLDLAEQRVYTLS